MVKLGRYGLIRVWFDLLGGGPGWWGVLVLAIGGLSALYGVLQAGVATDLKRLLGYSTTENVGLMLIGVGAAGLFAADNDRPLASLLMSPRRNSWPMTMAVAISAPRLHQVRPTMVENAIATSTPRTTLTTRSMPLRTMPTSVTCATSSAVSGASTGRVLGDSAWATA